MCVNGNAMPKRSVPSKPCRITIWMPISITAWSVWRTPFGLDVVPDV